MDNVREFDREGPDALTEGYRLMAADEEREKEAQEWAEALIADAFGLGEE
ncbi:MAG: hypothetical protein ACRD3N_09295 [Terracidiphilus sp.]